MKYARFEMAAIAVGSVAVLATALLSLRDVVELVAQLLILVVLIGAVHWGRRGGLLAAVVATVVYIVMRIPYAVDPILSGEFVRLVVIRTATYGLIGIAGGEICGRLKYFLAGLEDGRSVDAHSRVYTQHFVSQLIESHLSAFERYGTPFSLVIVELSPGITGDLRPSKTRQVVRAVASYVRNDLRLVDDVGRLDDGRFVLLLRQTTKAGAEVAAKRVSAGICGVLGAKEESVVAQVYGIAEDLDSMRAFAESIAPATAAAATEAATP